MSFLAYPEYKESGDEWLGKVPEHWQALALSRVLAAPVTDGPHTTPEFLDDGVPFLSVDGIQDGKLYFEGCRYVSFEDHKEFSKKAAPKYNDLLMGKAASIGKIARVTENIEFSIWSPLALIRVNKGQCSPEFLEFCLKSSELQHQVLLASNSNTQLNIGMKDIPKLRIPLPAVQEQTQIARFLDHETARIDALIEEQQRLIELLKEKRQAVISQAVTKGLDPTVQMKGSGVKWLGEVPAHWEITQIKRRCDLITDGAHISPETESGVYCFVSTRDVSDEGIDFDGCLRTSAASYEYLVKTGCQPATGDVLFSKDGTIGRTIVVAENSPDFVVASSLIIIRPNRAELLPTYLDFMCQSWVVSQQVDGFVKGAGLPRLSIQNLTKVVGVFPPLEEQALIADFLQLQCVAARQLSSEAWRTMELLKERRSALISAAVTGKIDVRAWQPPASVPTPKLVQEAV